MAWIRSQNKKQLYKSFGFEIVNGDVYCLFGTTVRKIGSYSTEEKALKVLDMIQETIIHNETVYAHEFSGSGVRDYDIFQMPADESL